MEEFTLKHQGFDLGLRGPEEVLRRHGNETFYADDTRGNYAHPKLGDYVQERCQGWGWTWRKWIWTWIEHGVLPQNGSF